MTSFMFNFAGDVAGSKKEDSEEIQWYESEEILPRKQLIDLDKNVRYAKMFTCEDVEIGYVNNINFNLSENGINNAAELAEKEHSDLVTGKYEGGFKIWECTYDLIEYLEKNQDIDLKNTKVLDLGCGVGILGIYALLKGASVTFQDYNKEVIECLTIPSILLNIEEEEDQDKILQRCRFYCGDWLSFNEILGENVYDIILTSETIYNTKNYDKLLELFQRRLSDGGTIFVAAKTCYFGVGGGTRQFETAIKHGGLSSQIIWKTGSGIQREIIKINK